MKITIALILFFITQMCFAQKLPFIRTYKPLDSTFTIRKNVIKFNPIEAFGSLAFGGANVYEVTYERVLDRKKTVSLVVEVGDIVYTSTMDYFHGTLYLKEWYINQGIRMSSQYRYYFLNRKNRFPRGYYAGLSPLYVHENEYYELWDVDEQIVKSLKSKNNYYGIGVLLGWQEMLKMGITFNIGARLYYGYNTAKNDRDIFIHRTHGLCFLGDFSIGYAFCKKISPRHTKKIK